MLSEMMALPLGPELLSARVHQRRPRTENTRPSQAGQLRSGRLRIPQRPNSRESNSIVVNAVSQIEKAEQRLPAVFSSPAENDILEAVSSAIGRGKSGLSPEDLSKLEKAVEKLEREGKGVKNPTTSDLLDGRWRLLYTSRPSTASPIQRTFTGVDKFSVFQEIDVRREEIRINNVVDFGKNVGFLKVEAAGSTDSKPLPGFSPREGKGLPFGILGVSSVEPPPQSNVRIDFQFDKAAFYFKSLPLTLPYPVPFRLLGDERKGWLDVTYLSKDGRFRLSRGNKGTLFVLVKDESPKSRLADVSSKKMKEQDIESLVEQVLEDETGVTRPAYSREATGGWRLVWTKQGSTANPLQQRLTRIVRNWQIISEDGSVLQNRVDLLPGVQVIAEATASPASPNRTRVVISEVKFLLGPLKFTLPIETDADGYVDWLFLDDNLRITKGNKGSLFVHVRDRSVE